MKRPGDSLVPSSTTQHNATRPGLVKELKGVIFQSDNSSLIGALFIRPIESFDRWQAGLTRGFHDAPLAMHAGLHVVMDDGTEIVAEQLVGTTFEDFHDALNWTPLEEFRHREGSGWDVTVPATAFRAIDDAAIASAIENLNCVRGHAFFGEDCTMFVERMFDRRRLFSDSPTGMAFGIGLRVGDPALPLLRPDAELEPRTARLLRAETIKAQPNPLAGHDAPNTHTWVGRVAVWAVLGIVASILARLFTRRKGRD